MEISTPNENGVVSERVEEIVARHGPSYAAVRIALCEDALYRQSTALSYSYGGFCGPIFMDSQGYVSAGEARTAALEELLRRWHRPFPSEPESVSVELADMRQQIVNQLQQPSFL